MLFFEIWIPVFVVTVLVIQELGILTWAVNS